jgi:hypothetical protein
VATWEVAGALEQLRAQLDELAPERSTASDGAIGDEDHRNRKSDHNPWLHLAGQHWVTARDFTHDPDGGLDCHELADALEDSRDPRIKYVIWSGEIMSGAQGRDPWEWREYTGGANEHRHHLHLSVVADARALSRIPWRLPGLTTVTGSPVLRRGSRGPLVAELQRVLNAWYPLELHLAEDEVFGPSTEKAVKLLQERAGLLADGVVGTRTRAVLNLGS